jgi:hypothetical protein
MQVDSPFTARVIDVDTDGPVPWLASEYVHGPTLSELVTAAGPLPGPPCLALAAALSEGVRDIHSAGLIHRDLRPTNVILAADRPRIVDFGLAAFWESFGAVGGVGYMSPEQARGMAVGPASDIFSLGATLTFAATGDMPLNNVPIFHDELEPTSVPETVRPLIASCMKIDPSQRLTATDLREDTYALAQREFGLGAADLQGLMGTILDFRAEIDGASYPEPELPTGTEAADADYGHGVRSIDAGGGDHGGALRAAGEEEPQPRFLTGILPERAPVGARISLLVQITLAASQAASAALKGFLVSPSGALVTITVSAPGLIPRGDLEQDLTVPLSSDSAPVRFGFTAGPVGRHSVQVRAFAGGTCLGDLTLEISVDTWGATEEGRPRTVPLAGLATEPGEVTLQVSRTAMGGYSFQLLSEALYPVVIIDRLAGDPNEVIGQMVAELLSMSKRTSQYATPALAHRRLRSLGSQLWADVVPETIREQFWTQHDRIKLFTIASDMDTVPWELLYPVDMDNDNGFLVEQFPVVRRVYGQSRERVLRLNRGVGFIVPSKPPANAMDEVAAVRAALPAYVLDRGTENNLGEVLKLLDAVPSVLHFVGHNAFTDEKGSLISLDGGPLRPSDLSYVRQRRAFESARPLIFFNGCRTAGEIPGFTQLTGWAKEFMGAGAGAFIGSLWAVRSTSARTFAEEFYNALVRDEESLGVASLRARQAITADEGDPTWLAYTVYGNPSASVIHNPRPYP